MASSSLNRWHIVRARELDQIENAHRQVGGPNPGRRYATEQINHAYTVLLSSQFQGFCRDLHSEAVDHITSSIASGLLRSILHDEFAFQRKLDRGNANAGNIASDFNRLGLAFLDEVRALSIRNIGRMNRLEEMNIWRNAIAHQDFAAGKLGRTMHLRLATVLRWRRACDQLAGAFDAVVGSHVAQVTGVRPW